MQERGVARASVAFPCLVLIPLTSMDAASTQASCVLLTSLPRQTLARSLGSTFDSRLWSDWQATGGAACTWIAKSPRTLDISSLFLVSDCGVPWNATTRPSVISLCSDTTTVLAVAIAHFIMQWR